MKKDKAVVPSLKSFGFGTTAGCISDGSIINNNNNNSN
eukprot:CAMPEP_0170903528 /NCGR_PEP_ID=MMETSP0734-20130129/49823_1 /TAXON_ID=186038 /ORGANISM="Fragilariopsis kerguelensis, Strain L26-C5" /LENGTH=37 /DNA_ID= /DNA_START= /DNA_END= /DNA_ORIENTATION=